MQSTHQAINEKDKREEDLLALKLEIAIRGVVRSSRTTGICGTWGSERDSMGSPYMRTPPLFDPRTRDGVQASIRSVVKRKEKQEADKVVERCLI